MSSAFVVLPPNVVRKATSDLEKTLPGLNLVPHNTHGELDRYFADDFGTPYLTHDLTVTAYPAAVAPAKNIAGSGLFRPMPDHLPPMRPMLTDQGMAEPNAFIKVIAFVPLVYIHHKSLQPPLESWEDLCSPVLHGKVVCPPLDTPMPALSRAFLTELYGEKGLAAATAFRPEMYPLDINKAVDDGQYLAGLVIPSFGRTFRNNGGVMVWPSEGAVAIPLMAMLKKDAGDEALQALDYLLSEEFQDFLGNSGVLIPVREGASLPPEAQPPRKIIWPGWEKLTNLGEQAA